MWLRSNILGEKVKPYLVVSLLLILMVIEPHTLQKLCSRSSRNGGLSFEEFTPGDRNDHHARAVV